MFDERRNPESFLYHYTRYATFRQFILPERRLRLSPYRATNDPRESKEWAFDASASTGELTRWFNRLNIEFDAKLRDGARVLCLTRDDPSLPSRPPGSLSGRGFAHSRMWDQYAERHGGVCLVLDRDSLLRRALQDIGTHGLLWHGEVTYAYEDREQRAAFFVDFDEVVQLGLDEFATLHIRRHHHALFFRKTPEWASEAEYRIVSWGHPTESLYLGIDGSLVALIVGTDFPDEEVSTLLGMLEPLGLDVARVSWRNGHPSITDRGMNIDRSRPPATREQIAHFLQMLNVDPESYFRDMDDSGTPPWSNRPRQSSSSGPGTSL